MRCSETENFVATDRVQKDHQVNTGELLARLWPISILWYAKDASKR